MAIFNSCIALHENAEILQWVVIGIYDVELVEFFEGSAIDRTRRRKAENVGDSAVSADISIAALSFPSILLWRIR